MNQESMALSVHWLGYTTRLPLDYVLNSTGRLLSSESSVLETGFNGYTRSHVFAGGVWVMVNPNRPDMGTHVLLRGESCEYHGAEMVSALYSAHEGQASRVDLALDGCPFTPEDLRREWMADNVVTVCKPLDPVRYKDQIKPGWEHVRTCDWRSKPTGDTFMMGSRSSTQYWRCYDQRDTGTRLEVEFKGERARLLAEKLFLEGADMKALYFTALSLFVSFVIPTEDSNRRRWPVQEWWGAFLGAFERVRVTLSPKPERTMDRLVGWTDNQVSRSFVLYHALKRHVLDVDRPVRDLMQRGLAKLRTSDLAFLSAAGVPPGEVQRLANLAAI